MVGLDELRGVFSKLNNSVILIRNHRNVGAALLFLEKDEHKASTYPKCLSSAVTSPHH